VVEATAEGLLCSQEARTPRDASQAPDFKKARISVQLRTEESAAGTTRTTTAGLRGTTTLLIRCDKRGGRHSVLVAVVHPCHLKEVKVSGDDTPHTTGSCRAPEGLTHRFCITSAGFDLLDGR